MKTDKRPAITPETKVGELLASYPHLEAILFEMSPAFKKLQNPVLRKTVAKVACLRHAAKIGQVNLGEFITRLRSAAGIGNGFAEESEEPSSVEQPEWWKPERVAKRIDVRPILDNGETPLSRVMADLGQLNGGEIYEITAGFFPAPLVDLARSKGFDTWWTQEDQEIVRVYLYRSPSSLDSPDSSLVELD